MAPASKLNLPGFDLPVDHLPDKHFPIAIGDPERDWKANTLLLREICIFRFIEEITNKPEWWIKVRNAGIAAKWKKEALTMDWTGLHKFADFVPSMAVACIEELKYKAELYEKSHLIPLFDYSAAVIKSDTLVPDPLWQELQEAVKPLENIPDHQKDWHPGSDGKVLNLVHPSLWPLIYGRSRIRADKRIPLNEALKSCGTGDVIPKPDKPTAVKHHSISTDFQWLPCDVVVEGAHAKIDSYINNLHPVTDKALYTVIEKFIEKALPAWDVLYRWPEEFDMQRMTTNFAGVRCRTKKTCGERDLGCTPKARPVRDDEPRRGRDEHCYSDSEIEDVDEDEQEEEDRADDGVAASYSDESSEQQGPVRENEEGFKITEPHETNKKRLLGNVRARARQWDSDFESEVSDEEDNADKDEDDTDEDEDEDENQDMGDERGPEHVSATETKRRDFRWFYKTHPVDVPNPPKACQVKIRPEDVKSSDFFSQVNNPDTKANPGSRRLQVIVKLANIHLTPEKPTYNGGSWHVEGQLNEHICATALFYHDSHNITESRLDFRTMANRDKLDEYPALEYGQSDWRSIQRTFGVGGSTEQEIGSVLTREKRALFFSNVYQHHVSPFRLMDKTRPGHRKILALFLVDPAVPVISTANVPPQQKNWWLDQFDLGRAGLPLELTEMTLGNLDFPMGEEDAKGVRRELMRERSASEWRAADSMRRVEWNFCEH